MRVHLSTVIVVLSAAVMISDNAVPVSQAGCWYPPADEPAVIMAVAPVVPPVAVASNSSGEVIVEAMVDAMGVVASAHTISGHPLLRQVRTFEETARRWRFAPSTDGVSTHTVRLTFAVRIMPKDTPPAELATVFMPPYKVEVRHLPLEPIVHSDPPSYVRPSRSPKKVRRP